MILFFEKFVRKRTAVDERKLKIRNIRLRDVFYNTLWNESDVTILWSKLDNYFTQNVRCIYSLFLLNVCDSSFAKSRIVSGHSVF